MKKLWAVTMILAALAALTGTSFADIVYTTSDSSLGLIRVNSTTDIKDPELMYPYVGADPLVGSYTVGTSPYVMVVDRASNNALGDTALIFNASNLILPVDSVVLRGVHNTKRFASSYNGRSIFFASGEDSSIIEFTTSSLDIQIDSYIYDNSSEDILYEPELVDMSVGVYYIYALFRATPYKLELFSFDGQLKDGVKNTIRKTIRNDATSVVATTSSRFAVGADTGISMGNNNGTISPVVSTDYPVIAVCRDRDSGLYYAERSESGDIELYHYSSDRGTVTLVDFLEERYTCQFVRDGDKKILAAMIGDSIYMYDMTTDNLITLFDSSALGGIPLNMALTVAVHDDGSTSSSNCDVSSVGAIMMSVLCIALMRRKR